MTVRTTSPPSTKATHSPSGAYSRRFVDALQLGNRKDWNFLSNLKEEEAAGTTTAANTKKKSRYHQAPQRELVLAILEDQEQWEKLHRAMQRRRCCTSMGLTQNLHGLLQDRINDMEDCRRQSLSSSPTNSM